MDGLATNDNFPAAERTYSHVSVRKQAKRQQTQEHTSTSSTDSTCQDEIVPYDQSLAPLTPQTTKSTARPPLSRDISRFTTHGTTYTSNPAFEVDFEPGDPDDPRNWPTWYFSP